MKDYQRFAVGAFVIVAAALITFGVYNRFTKRVSQEEPAPLPTPESGFPTVEISPPPVQPESGSNAKTVNNLGIVVTEPSKNSIISSPVKVSGFANVFEGLVVIRVKDANGSVLGKETATTCMDVDACPFEASINFLKPGTELGTVEVLSPSPVDGSFEYLQEISVKFR